MESLRRFVWAAIVAIAAWVAPSFAMNAIPPVDSNDEVYVDIAYELLDGDATAFEELSPEEQKIVGSIVGEIYDGMTDSEISESSDLPETNGSPSDWPRSMWDFKYPFSGLYNNWWSGEVWKITCGYNCNKHWHNCYPGAAKHSVDLVRDDGGQTAGSFVLTPARGVVTFAGWQSGYGWCVELDHRNGYRSIVAHLACDPNAFTQVGHDLLQGTLIGITGSSGTNSAHIHFSVWQYNCSVELYGISGGGGVVVGGRYCSGNAYVPSPKGRTTCP